MKTFIFLAFIVIIAMTACQKPAVHPDNTRVTEDSVITQGDQLTYEVITADPGGWFGVWNGSDGVLTSNGFDNITWGSPNYLMGSWRYNFTVPSRPFQAFISVAVKSYNYDVTVNLYKNGHLIKTAFNEGQKGMSKLLLEAQTGNLVGTATNPVVTYQVLVTDPNMSKFESDAWIGQWATPDGTINSVHDATQSALFPMPSGWEYSFKPDHMPYTMRFGGSPYSTDGGKMTINFYVNGQLVKTSSARQWIYGMEYVVQ